jgi:hypothetical protein
MKKYLLILIIAAGSLVSASSVPHQVKLTPPVKAIAHVEHARTANTVNVVQKMV